jgi:hypothetical protein
MYTILGQIMAVKKAKSAPEPLHCHGCRQTTKHRLLKSAVDTGGDEEQGFYWRTTFEMLQCCGCAEVVLRRKHWFSEDPDVQVSVFPAPASRWLPEWQWHLPAEIRVLLKEVYASLQADGLALAMMGSRALIETSMVKKVGDHGNFDSNLQAMVYGGYLSNSNRQYLAVALDAGSASAHRAHRPCVTEMKTVMDIVENLLHSLFVLEKKTKTLAGTIPARPPVIKRLAKPKP